MTLDEALQEYEAGRAWLGVSPAEREAVAADMDLGGVPGDERRAQRLQKAGRPEFDALVRQRRELFQTVGIPTESVPAELDPVTSQTVVPPRVRPLEKLPRPYQPSVMEETVKPAAKALVQPFLPPFLREESAQSVQTPTQLFQREPASPDSVRTAHEISTFNPQEYTIRSRQLNQDLRSLLQEMIPLVTAEKQHVLPNEQARRLTALWIKKASLQTVIERLDQGYADWQKSLNSRRHERGPDIRTVPAQPWQAKEHGDDGPNLH